MLGALACAGLCSGHFPCLWFLTSLVVQVQILQCNATTPALWFSLPRVCQGTVADQLMWLERAPCLAERAGGYYEVGRA